MHQFLNRLHCTRCINGLINGRIDCVVALTEHRSNSCIARSMRRLTHLPKHRPRSHISHGINRRNDRRLKDFFNLRFQRSTDASTDPSTQSRHCTVDCSCYQAHHSFFRTRLRRNVSITATIKTRRKVISRD